MATLPDFASHELKKFLESGKPGSLTLHSDGQFVRQVQVNLIVRGGDDGGKKEEKGR